MFSGRLFFRVTHGLEEGSIGKNEMTFAIPHGDQLRAVFDRLNQTVHLLIGVGAFSDVLQAGDEVGDLPFLVLHRGDGQLFTIEAAVFSAIDEFPLPLSAGKNGLPYLLVKGRGMLAGLEQARVLSNGLFLRVTRQSLEGGIGPDDRCLAVSDEDGVFGSFESSGLEFKQLPGALALVFAGRISLLFLHGDCPG